MARIVAWIGEAHGRVEVIGRGRTQMNTDEIFGSQSAFVRVCPRPIHPARYPLFLSIGSGPFDHGNGSQLHLVTKPSDHANGSQLITQAEAVCRS